MTRTRRSSEVGSRSLAASFSSRSHAHGIQFVYVYVFAPECYPVSMRLLYIVIPFTLAFSSIAFKAGGSLLFPNKFPNS